MHHSCVQPSLPGRPQPCPACDADARGSDAPPTGVYPHEMEVGAPRRREALPFVGVDAGAVVEAPLEGPGFPTDSEARAQGYQDVEDWYSRAVAPSLRGTPALAVEVRTLEVGAARSPGEEADEIEYEPGGRAVDAVATIHQSAQGTSEPAVCVSGSPPGPVGFRPLSDAEP